MAEIEELHIEPGHGPNVIKNDDHSNLEDKRLLRHRIKRTIRDTLLVIVAIVLSAIILIGAYFAISAVYVANEVRAAAATVTSLRSTDFTADDAAGKLKTASDELRRHADAAYTHTSNPIWVMAGRLPGYGGDVEAVRTSVDVLHQVADDALPLLTDAASEVDVSRISISDGSISIPGIRNAAPKLAKANEIIAGANKEFQSIDGVTLGALQRQLKPAQEQFATLAETSDTISRGAQLLPRMLGLDDPNTTRTYLVLAQNNSEIRATGGISGAFGLLSVKGGKVEMHDFISTSQFGSFEQPAIELQPDEQALFGSRMGEFMQDANFTPDFSRTGQIAKAMWEAKQGGTIDGVISMDPIFLQRVLSAVGSVTVSGGNGMSVTLDGSNTAQSLLNKVYFALPKNTDQDVFFGLAAKASFDKILHSSSANPAELVKQVISSAKDGHLYAWSAREDEQKLLSGTLVGGTLVTEESDAYMGSKAPQQVIGVYYNDAMASKMDWYLDRSVEDKVVQTYPNGRERHEVTIRMKNTLSAADVAGLPDYIIGTLENGAVKGNIQFINYLYVPAGGSVPEYAAGPNGDKGDNYAVHDGLTVVAKQISLAPGETYEIKATIYTAPGSATGRTIVRQTPLVR